MQFFSHSLGPLRHYCAELLGPALKGIWNWLRQHAPVLLWKHVSWLSMQAGWPRPRQRNASVILSAAEVLSLAVVGNLDSN